MKRKFTGRWFFLLTLLSTFFLPAHAQDDTDALKNANNPLAKIKALNIQNYYAPSLYENEGTINTFYLRYAQPIGWVLLRASMPFNTYPKTEGTSQSGLGDFNIFGIYLISRPDATNLFGVGSLITLPTATAEALGSGKWKQASRPSPFSPKTRWYSSGDCSPGRFPLPGRVTAGKSICSLSNPFRCGSWARALTCIRLPSGHTTCMAPL